MWGRSDRRGLGGQDYKHSGIRIMCIDLAAELSYNIMGQFHSHRLN